MYNFEQDILRETIKHFTLQRYYKCANLSCLFKLKYKRRRFFGVTRKKRRCTAVSSQGHILPGVAVNLYFREYVPMGIDSLRFL